MAELNFLTPIDLNGNEVRNFAHQTVAVLPDATTRAYQVLAYSGALYWSDGIKWMTVGTVTDLSQHALSELGAPTGDLSMAGFKITNLAAPVADTDAANLAAVKAAVAALVNSSPQMLQTLHALADAINDDPNFATTITNRLASDEARISALEHGTSGNLARKFAGSVGDGSATSFVLVHNLNTRDVSVSLYDAASYAQVLTTVTLTDVNSVTVSFAQAPTAGAYRAVVTG